VDVQSEGEITYLSKIISYLVEAMYDKKRDVRKLSITGNNRFFIYFRDTYMLCVVADPDINVPLLNLVAERELTRVGAPEVGESPKLIKTPLEDKVPILYRPREEVLPNVELYARQVLEFVDGNRSIRDIIDQSNLPQEQVWSVILAYRRSSELFYKE
jgi:hypothetical protein